MRNTTLVLALLVLAAIVTGVTESAAKTAIPKQLTGKWEGQNGVRMVVGPRGKVNVSKAMINRAGWYHAKFSRVTAHGQHGRLSISGIPSGVTGASAASAPAPPVEHFTAVPAPSEAGSGGSNPAFDGCTNHATTSNFREKLPTEPVLPLPQIPAGAVSVPTWSGSFTTDGTAYPFTMVGSDPATGSATHVSVEIIPLRLVFPGTGCVLERSGMAAEIESSPLFAPIDFGPDVGVTQYLDGFQRSNFWSTVSAVGPGYHLLLDPSDIPAVTLNVPASQGITIPDPDTNGIAGIVGGNWLSRQLQSLISSLHISPTTLPVFVPYNTFVTDQNPTDCLVSCSYYIGYHYATVTNSGKKPLVNTFVMASYDDLGSQLPPDWNTSSWVLSHEILEWANDPFDHTQRVQGQVSLAMNTAPSYTSPYYGPGTPCQTDLEVADPLEYFPFIIGVKPGASSTIYATADGAFLPWFSRESPSTSYGGLYDPFGIFSTYSIPC
jgi:hypothetical protein